MAHFPLPQPQAWPSHFSRCHGYRWLLASPSVAQTCCTWNHTIGKSPKEADRRQKRQGEANPSVNIYFNLNTCLTKALTSLGDNSKLVDAHCNKPLKWIWTWPNGLRCKIKRNRVCFSTQMVTAFHDLGGLLLWSVHFFSDIEWMLTAPRSTMKQSPLLKLDQLSRTSVALTTRRPLMWKSLWAERSLVTTWWKPVDFSLPDRQGECQQG